MNVNKTKKYYNVICGNMYFHCAYNQIIHLFFLDNNFNILFIQHLFSALYTIKHALIRYL